MRWMLGFLLAGAGEDGVLTVMGRTVPVWLVVDVGKRSLGLEWRSIL